MAASDAQPLPRRGQAWRWYFNIPKTDGTYLTSGAGLAATLSKDGAAAASVTNAPVEAPAASGFYYIDFTADETDADALLIRPSSSSSGAVTVPHVIYTDTGQLDIVEALCEYSAEVVGDIDSDMTGVIAEIAAINAVIPVMSDNISDVETATTNLQTDLDALSDAVQAAQEDIDALQAGVTLADNALTSAKTAASFVTEIADAVADAVGDGGGGGGGGGSVTLLVGLNASGRLPDGVLRYSAGDVNAFVEYELVDTAGRPVPIPEEAVVTFNLRAVGADEATIEDGEASVDLARRGIVRFTFDADNPVPEAGEYIAQFRYNGFNYPIGKHLPIVVVEAA